MFFDERAAAVTLRHAPDSARCRRRHDLPESQRVGRRSAHVGRARRRRAPLQRLQRGLRATVRGGRSPPGRPDGWRRNTLRTREDDRHRSRDRDAWSEDAVMQRAGRVASVRAGECRNPSPARTADGGGAPRRRARRGRRTTMTLGGRSTARRTPSRRAKEHGEDASGLGGVRIEERSAGAHRMSRFRSNLQSRGRLTRSNAGSRMMTERLQANATPVSSNGDPNETLPVGNAGTGTCGDAQDYISGH